MLTIEAKLAKSFLDRLLGLISPNNPRTMFFETRFGLHTFFLEQPIDILVLDFEHKVKVLKHSLSPNHFFFYPPAYKYVLELPEGYIKDNHVKLDDKINLCLT